MGLGVVGCRVERNKEKWRKEREREREREKWWSGRNGFWVGKIEKGRGMKKKRGTRYWKGGKGVVWVDGWGKQKKEEE